MSKRRFPVTQAQRAPARPDGTCFHCEVPIGGEHAAECPHRTKQVMIAATFTIPWTVPEHWDRQLIEFRLNESTFCADNLLDDLRQLAGQHGCLCKVFTGTLVEPAAADEALPGG
jgi:hypothetical protein